ncbi:hypothetical protein B566_EDAN012730 [Ephemera danica]|nr:hypothetical protein B566_EDAN012730 [Ephemera danica]
MSATDAAGLNKSWELSLYELHRTPQVAITDNTEIAVSPRSLHSELMCPICLDMLKKTMTTKECLHRFCSDCIITALRSGNKECPTCRKKLVSKRSLRPDPNFDSLISKIYPSRDEYEAHQERVLAKLNKSHSQAALVNSISEGIKLQSQNRPQRRPKTANETDMTPTNTPNVSAPSTPTPMQQGESVTPVPQQGPSSHAPSPVNMMGVAQQPSGSSGQLVQPKLKKVKVATSENDSGSDPGGQDSVGDGDGPSSSEPSVKEIELVFKPHPTEMAGENSPLKALKEKEEATRFIKTTANATVDHLSKYIAMRLTLNLADSPPDSLLNFCIYIAPTPGHYVVLGGNLTLGQVNEKYWKVNKPLEMFYSWKKS